MSYCPRCVARTRTLVELVSSRLPRADDSLSQAQTATGR